MTNAEAFFCFQHATQQAADVVADVGRRLAVPAMVSLSAVTPEDCDLEFSILANDASMSAEELIKALNRLHECYDRIREFADRIAVAGPSGR